MIFCIYFCFFLLPSSQELSEFESELLLHSQALSKSQDQNKLLLAEIEQQKMESLQLQELLQDAQKQLLLAGIKKPHVKRNKNVVSLPFEFTRSKTKK